MISSSFTPRRILLTGGTGALGHVVTKRLLQAGHRVATTWRVDHERERLISDLGPRDDQLLFVAADDVRVLSALDLAGPRRRRLSEQPG
jgi:nucleoside-diphosphate-sugar epimerase